MSACDAMGPTLLLLRLAALRCLTAGPESGRQLTIDLIDPDVLISGVITQARAGRGRGGMGMGIYTHACACGWCVYVLGGRGGGGMTSPLAQERRHTCVAAFACDSVPWPPACLPAPSMASPYPSPYSLPPPPPSHLPSQVAADPDLQGVFQDLFTSDGDEMYFKPPSAFRLPTDGTPVAWGAVQDVVRGQGQTVLGLMEPRAPGQGGLGDEGAEGAPLRMAISSSEEVVLRPWTKLVVLAQDM